MSQPRIWMDDHHFFTELSHPKWRVILSFKITDLSQGASLSRMMNEWIASIYKANARAIDRRELNAAAREVLPHLREQVESYFDGIGPVGK